MKTDITTREDVNTLVRTFYNAIRAHEVLAPFFETAITDWDEHIEKLTDFWEASLFLKTKRVPREMQLQSRKLKIYSFHCPH